MVRGQRAWLRVCLLTLVGCLLLSSSAQASSKPKLTKAGIACAKADDGSFCLLYIRAKRTRNVEFSLRRGRPLMDAAYNGKDIFGATSWYRNPVRKQCLRVRARAENKRGSDAGTVRLCDVGYGPATSPIETAWTYADYHRFK